MKVVELNPKSERSFPSTFSATHVVLTLAARGLDSSSFRDGQRRVPALLIGKPHQLDPIEAINPSHCIRRGQEGCCRCLHQGGT